MKGKMKWYQFRLRAVYLGLALGLLVIAVSWYLIIGRYQHEVGEGPAGPEVSPELFTEIWTEKEVILLGMGDSITDGYGSSKYKGYFDNLYENDPELYPDMTGRDLLTVIPNLRKLNFAVSYTVSDQHLKEQLPLIKPFDENTYGIVALTSGGNDLIHDYGRSEPLDGTMYGCTLEQAKEWESSFRDRMNLLLEGIKLKFPGGCDIFLANIYDPTDGVGDIENAHPLLPEWPDGLKVHTLWNETIKDICSNYDNVHMVDIHSVFLGHGSHCSDRNNPNYRNDDPHYWYHDNLEDPNDRGYDAIRRTYLNKIVSLCSGKLIK